MAYLLKNLEVLEVLERFEDEVDFMVLRIKRYI